MFVTLWNYLSDQNEKYVSNAEAEPREKQGGCKEGSPAEKGARGRAGGEGGAVDDVIGGYVTVADNNMVLEVEVDGGPDTGREHEEGAKLKHGLTTHTIYEPQAEDGGDQLKQGHILRLQLIPYIHQDFEMYI